MVEFGEQLRRAREAKGMTQQSLAEQLYVTRQAYTDFLNVKTSLKTNSISELNNFFQMPSDPKAFAHQEQVASLYESSIP